MLERFCLPQTARATARCHAVLKRRLKTRTSCARQLVITCGPSELRREFRSWASPIQRDYRDIDAQGTMPETASDGKLVWIDCEMTGLDSETDSILSVACFVTGPDLDILDEQGYVAIVHHDQERLDKMGEWCTAQHGASGLTAAVLESKTTAEEAATALLEYIKTFVKEPRKALLAGNTVHADKAFLRKPPYTRVIDHLHHRILDVSSIKEAARRWSSEEVLKNSPQKKGAHDARIDILESIAEARYYRSKIFGRTS